MFSVILKAVMLCHGDLCQDVSLAPLPRFPKSKYIRSPAGMQPARCIVGKRTEQRFRPLPGRTNKRAKENVGQAIEPSVHGNHGCVHHSGVGTRHTDVTLPELFGKTVGKNSKGELAAPISGKLRKLSFAWKGLGDVPKHTRDTGGEDDMRPWRHQRGHKACQEGCGKTVDTIVKLHSGNVRGAVTRHGACHIHQCRHGAVKFFQIVNKTSHAVETAKVEVQHKNFYTLHVVAETVCEGFGSIYVAAGQHQGLSLTSEGFSHSAANAASGTSNDV